MILRLLFIATFLLCPSTLILAQNEDYIATIERHQDSLRTFYITPETSPLQGEAKGHFEGLDFYEIREDFRVSAQFTGTPDEKPFPMATSAGVAREYVKYGEIVFELEGKPCTLNVYRNPAFAKTPDHEYADALMLGFTDYTSGDGSYGGGRYVDIGISQIIDGKITVDFNKAYNPYCAYTSGYACAIPPEDNDLKLRVEVGIKDNAGAH